MLVRVSPWLFFAVLLRRAHQDMRQETFIVERWAGEKVQLFDADRVMYLLEEAELREYYLENIFPLVTPIAMDPAHPFPFISNLSINLLVEIHDPTEDDPHLVRIKAPITDYTPRLMQIGEELRVLRTGLAETVTDPDMKTLSHMYRHAWHTGLKTTYYLRTMQASNIEKATVHVSKVAPPQQNGAPAPATDVGAVNACSILDPECEACQ